MWRVPAPRPARVLSVHPDANGHPSPGRFAAAASGGIGNFWKSNPHQKAPSPTPAPMGSYLSTPKPAPEPLTQGRRNPWPRPSQAEDGGPRIRSRPLPQMPPNWDPSQPQRVVTEAWRRFPAKPPPETVLGPDLSSAWESYVKRWLWSARHPRQIWSPVTVRIAPPEHRESPWVSQAQAPSACSAGHPPAEERPDPCAKETVLRALSQCQKGNRKFVGPLWFEIPEGTSRRRKPEPRPSAFKPLIRNGVVPSFVPRPGPLSRSPHSWSDNVCREVADLQPDAQPSLSAAHPAAAGVSAQGPDPQLQSWEKMQRSWGLPPSSSA